MGSQGIGGVGVMEGLVKPVAPWPGLCLESQALEAVASMAGRSISILATRRAGTDRGGRMTRSAGGHWPLASVRRSQSGHSDRTACKLTSPSPFKVFLGEGGHGGTVGELEPLVSVGSRQAMMEPTSSPERFARRGTRPFCSQKGGFPPQNSSSKQRSYHGERCF